jgi:bacillolysin
MPAEFKSLERLAQHDPALRFRSDEELGVVVHLRGALADRDGEPERAGLAFMSEHRDLFGDVDPESLTMRDAGEDPGGRHAVLEQRHDGLRVLGGSIRFHCDHAGRLDTVANHLFPDLGAVPRQPELNAKRAVAPVRRATGSKAPLADEPELIVMRHEGRPRLTWEVRLDTDQSQRGDHGEPTQWIAYVDAVSGELLLHYNNIQTAAVTGAGTGYYSGAGSINAWSNNGSFQLRDTTRTATGGPEIRTNDEDGASPSEDADNNWNAVSAAPRHDHQGPEVDAHRYAGAVVDYYRSVHGHNSFDGAGATLTNVVHVGTDLSNGFWDGTQVNLGDGTGVAPGDDFECSDDWLAHEWTHAVTEHTCALIYYSESGALNESFSDVMAAFITGDWLVFEDTWQKPTAPAWRNMIDPTNGGQWNSADPITSVLDGHQPSHYGDRYTGTWDNAGVHVNSGIVNHLFYLLTAGGVHAVSGVAVSGIGQAAAEALLWRCMTVNLVGLPNATFLQFREAMLDATLDLFPGDLFKLAQVKAAFNAVGIGPDTYVRDNVADTGAEPFPGSYLYASPDIISRTAPSANPAVDFANLGDDSLWQNVEFGQDNYVYVRLQNRGPQAGDATVRVFFSAASTFGTPASWIPVGTVVETGIAPGSLRIAGPITFPKASIPAPDHYCMIAVVSSSLDPAPDHTAISSVWMYLDYVRGTNNIAYRNMDVVDAIPATPGSVSMIVRGLGDEVEGYALRIDDERFVPGARLLVRGPAEVLERAEPRGLKLVGREDGDLVYEVLQGRERRRHLQFHRDEGPGQAGFAQLRVEQEFVLRLDYELPDRRSLAELERPRGRELPVLAVRQSYQGEDVGANGIRLRLKR